ncbi:hypothetical protein C8R44DRAFT_885207 [Mycena epipterygia]|nr:hypothetical protein C8R44DRAFT_885207 [Mycena epipterygia]
MKFTFSVILFTFAAIAWAAPSENAGVPADVLPIRPGDMAGNIDVPVSESKTPGSVVGF